MTWSDRAADDLSERLSHVDLHSAAPVFGELWSVLVAWGERSFGDLTATMSDEIELLWAWHEPRAQEDWSYFQPPEALGEPLFGLSVSRTVTEQTGPTSSTGCGGAGLDLFFEDSSFWEDALRDVRGYLGRGAAYPALEYHVDSRRLGDFTDDVFVQRTLARPLLALDAAGTELVWSRGG